MQRLATMSAVCAMAMVGGIASHASATVLFTSNGFETSGGYTSNTALVGQPASADARDQWTGVVNVGDPTVNNSYPLAGVFSYNLPTNGNYQYALLQAPNVTPGSYGYYYPKTNTSVASGGRGTYTPAANESVAITFAMNVYGGYAATAANSEFYGITAFNGNGDEIASLGLNNYTGALALPSGATTYNGGFTGSFDTFYSYELLLDYATQTWSIYTEPNATGATYTLRASGAFANASTDFSDADLATFTLSTGNGSGYAAFDDYTVQTLVPEPASLTAGGLVFGLLAGRRRRAV